MADVLVTCINKPDRNSRHEHITHLGNPATPQGGWRWTREQVIESIEQGTNTFFTRDPITGKRADIRVVRLPGYSPYVQTYADGIWTDNLLSLSECPLPRPG
jgi:Protein of unknown function (DUF3892)